MYHTALPTSTTTSITTTTDRDTISNRIIFSTKTGRYAVRTDGDGCCVYLSHQFYNKNLFSVITFPLTLILLQFLKGSYNLTYKLIGEADNQEIIKEKSKNNQK